MPKLKHESPSRPMCGGDEFLYQLLTAGRHSVHVVDVKMFLLFVRVLHLHFGLDRRRAVRITTPFLGRLMRLTSTW